jgi:hypothetical protein
MNTVIYIYTILWWFQIFFCKPLYHRHRPVPSGSGVYYKCKYKYNLGGILKGIGFRSLDRTGPCHKFSFVNFTTTISYLCKKFRQWNKRNSQCFWLLVIGARAIYFPFWNFNYFYWEFSDSRAWAKIIEADSGLINLQAGASVHYPPVFNFITLESPLALLDLVCENPGGGLLCSVLPGLDNGSCLSGPMRPLRLVACVMSSLPSARLLPVARGQPPA